MKVGLILLEGVRMKIMTRTIYFFVILLLVAHNLLGQDNIYLDSIGTGNVSAVSGISGKVTVYIVYDNYLNNGDLTADWGYSVLITGLPKTILFDTGSKPEVFEDNFRKMDLDATQIDYLVLSHEHGDHTEGIPGFLRLRKGIPVIIPHSFSDEFKSLLVKFELEPLLIDKSLSICHNLYTSGEFPDPSPEQALVIDTSRGLVVMTGCSHPGIIRMLKDIKSTFNKNIYMVFGGFHLLDKSDEEMISIVNDMKSLGVVKCGATHCTGDHQIEMFRKSFGKNFVEMGAGNSIIID